MLSILDVFCPKIKKSDLLNILHLNYSLILFTGRKKTWKKIPNRNFSPRADGAQRNFSRFLNVFWGGSGHLGAPFTPGADPGRDGPAYLQKSRNISVLLMECDRTKPTHAVNVK